MNEQNQQVHYGAIIAISVQEIPPQTTGKYLGLFQEISLRLENTPPSEALRVPFEDPKMLAGAHSALKKMFKGQPVAVLKRAGALFIYNTVAQAKRHTDGPRGPRKIRTSNGDENGNGRRLDLPDMAQVMAVGGVAEEGS